MWQSLLRRKYLSNKTLTQVKKKPGDSHFWSGLMKIKDQFLGGGGFNVQNGTQIRFWEDKWIGDKPLGIAYPALYNLVRRKDATVAQVMSSRPLNVSFRRAIQGYLLHQWLDLVVKVLGVSLNEGRDIFIWELSGRGVFTVKSMYKSLVRRDVIPLRCPIWKIKTPLKIKIFLWYIIRGVTLTKYNLAKRRCRGSYTCCFSSISECIQHLFFN